MCGMLGWRVPDADGQEGTVMRMGGGARLACVLSDLVSKQRTHEQRHRPQPDLQFTFKADLQCPTSGTAWISTKIIKVPRERARRRRKVRCGPFLYRELR